MVRSEKKSSPLLIAVSWIDRADPTGMGSRAERGQIAAAFPVVHHFKMTLHGLENG